MARTKHKSRDGWLSPGPSVEDQSSQLADHHSTRIPANTPPTISKALARLLNRADELPDADAAVSISLAYLDTQDELTGILIADAHTMSIAARMMSPGVRCVLAGRRAVA